MNTKGSLFWIICRIGKYTREEESFYPVTTKYLDPVFVRFDKLFVEQDIPLAVEVSTMAMSQKGLCRLAPCPSGDVVLERLGQLVNE